MMSIRSLVETLLNGFDCISSGSVSNSSDADSRGAILYMTLSTNLALRTCSDILSSTGTADNTGHEHHDCDHV